MVDDDAKEKTKYHADPEEDVARRAANSSPAVSFCSQPHHPSFRLPSSLKDALARDPERETFVYKPRRKDG